LSAGRALIKTHNSLLVITVAGFDPRRGVANAHRPQRLITSPVPNIRGDSELKIKEAPIRFARLSLKRDLVAWLPDPN
jgi:hypothetical protein